MADKKSRMSPKELDALMEEISDELCYVRESTREYSKEWRYLTDFIHWKGLDEEYRQFQQEAVVEDDPNNPFPYLVMPAEVKNAG